MTQLVYRGVRYESGSLPKDPAAEMPTLRYRGFEYNPRTAWLAARPIYTSRMARVYRGVSDRDGGPGGNAIAAV